MKNPSRRSAVKDVAASLRNLSYAVPEGTLLGNEEALVERLAAGRNTVRQAARLLEREGVMRVRCGVNGGYFAARPNLGTIEQIMSAYLTSIAVTVKDVTYVASLLWAEAVRRAAHLPPSQARPVVDGLTGKVEAITANTPFQTIMDLEQEIRSAIFSLTGSAYIELIFQINHAFARSKAVAAEIAVTQQDPEFAAKWRKGKLMELHAIADGDEKLAMMAAHHGRNLWHERFWGGV